MLKAAPLLGAGKLKRDKVRLARAGRTGRRCVYKQWPQNVMISSVAYFGADRCSRAAALYSFA